MKAHYALSVKIVQPYYNILYYAEVLLLTSNIWTFSPSLINKKTMHTIVLLVSLTSMNLLKCFFMLLFD